MAIGYTDRGMDVIDCTGSRSLSNPPVWWSITHGAHALCVMPATVLLVEDAAVGMRDVG